MAALREQSLTRGKTIAALRGLLLKHGIEYPSSTRRAAFVKAVEDNQAAILKTERKETEAQPSASGIVDASENDAFGDWSDLEPQSPILQPRRRSGRIATKRQKKQEGAANGTRGG